MAKLKKYFAALLGLVAALVLLLVLFVLSPMGTGILLPPIAQRVASGAGIDLEVSDVGGALWSEVLLEGIEVSLRGGTSVYVGRLAFGLDLWSLTARRVRIQPLRMVDVRIRVDMETGDVAPTDTTTSAKGGTSWQVEVSDISIDGGHIALVRAPWIESFLEATALDSAVADSLWLEHLQIDTGDLAFTPRSAVQSEVAVSGLSAVIEPIDLRVDELSLTALTVPDTARLERLALKLPHGAVEAEGRVVRTSGEMSAGITFDSVRTDDLGYLVPPLARGLLASGSATIAAVPDSEQLDVTVTRSKIDDPRLGGTLNGDARVARIRQGRWDVLEVEAMMKGVAAARIPGADTLFPAGAIYGRVHTRGGQDSLQLFADLLLATDTLGGGDTLSLNMRGGLSAVAELRFDGVRVVAWSTPGLLGRWMDVPHLTDRALLVDGVIGGALSRMKLEGTLYGGGRGSSAAGDTVEFGVTPFLAVEDWNDPSSSSVMIDSLRYRVEYRGEPGIARSEGNVSVRDSLWTFDSVKVLTTDLNLNTFFGQIPATRLGLEGTGDFRIANGEVEAADFEFTADSSEVAGVSLTAAAGGSYRPDVWILDSLSLEGPGYSLLGNGRLGSQSRLPDSIGVRIDVTSLGELWPLVEGILDDRYALDTMPEGRITIASSISGTTAEPEIRFELRSDELAVAGIGAGRVDASGHTDRSLRGDLSVDVDSLFGFGRTADHLSLGVTGDIDSASARISVSGGKDAFGGLLTVETVDRGRVVTIDSLTFRHADDRWQARDAAKILVSRGAVEADSLILNGPRGRVVLAGSVSQTDSASMTVALERMPMDALGSFILPDSGWSIAGLLDARLTMKGPLADPALQVWVKTDSTILNNHRLADAEANLVVTAQGTEMDLGLEDDSTLFATGRLPVRFQGEPLRISVDGNGVLDVRIKVNGADAARLQPLLVNVEEPRGAIVADLSLKGTVERPSASGYVRLRRGHAYMPSLDVVYDGVELAATLDGATARIDSLLLPTADGWLRAEGTVDLAPLHDPTLDMSVSARRFRAINDAQFLTLTASGALSLTGRLEAPTVAGTMTAESAVLRFADIIEKDVVDLASPIFAGVVDTTVLRSEGLEPGLMQRMQDSLVLDSLVVALGSDVWLRSEDANVQLGGEAAVSKEADQYRVYGTFVAQRGTYQLSLGPAATREFRITGGSVRYFGDPGRDADLDIDAEHTVTTYRGERVDVYANIGGTLTDPDVTLESSLGPRVSDTEIISYLLFGAPSVQVFAGSRGREQQSVFQRSAQQLANFLSGTLESSLTGSLGIPVDYLRINPGDVNRGFSSAEVLVGKQLDLFGQPAFLTASPRLCPGRSLISLKTTGASLETWFASNWLAAASIDPVRACEVNAVGTSTYSVGIDLFWEKH